MSDHPPTPHVPWRTGAAALVAATLILGACTTASDSGPESSGQVDTNQSSDTGTGDEGSAADPEAQEAEEPVEEAAEEVVEEPPAPEPVTLALQPHPGSTDPRETINHLPAVDVTTGPDGVFITVDGTPPNTIRVPLTHDGDYVILTVAGTAYMAQEASFADSPAMVQIDPGSGALAQDVVSTIGMISAVDLAAQLD